MVFPTILALKGAAAAQLAALAGGGSAKQVTTVVEQMQKGARALQQLTAGSEETVVVTKPSDTGDGSVRMDRPADVWLHRRQPAWFVGKTVKVDFRVPGGSHEFLWVKVVAAGQQMVGQLRNTPNLLADKQLGSTVTFKMKQIVDVQVASSRGGSGRRRR